MRTTLLLSVVLSVGMLNSRSYAEPVLMGIDHPGLTRSFVGRAVLLQSLLDNGLPGGNHLDYNPRQDVLRMIKEIGTTIVDAQKE